MKQPNAVVSKAVLQQMVRWTLAYGAILGIAMGAVSARDATAQSNSRAVTPAEWNKIIDAAKNEGKVVVYATMAPTVHSRIVAAFNKAYPGITMELVRVIGTAINTKFEQERNIPGFDGGDMMLTADVRWAIDAQKKGWLRTPVGPAAQAWPETYLKHGQIVMLDITLRTMVYNTDLVKIPITGYQDLLRPELNGKIGAPALVAEVITAWYKWLDDGNPGFLEKLAAQKVRLYASTTATANATGSGEIATNAFSATPVDKDLIALKAPVRSVIPNPVFYTSYGGAIVSWAKHPNAALIALDFLMSVRGQTAIVGDQEAASPLPKVPGAIEIGNLNIQTLDPEKTSPEVLKAFEAKWNSLFKAR